MKFILYFFPIVVLLSACKETTSENKPVNLEGNWVSQEFLETLNQNHSPKTTVEKLTLYVTELLIDNRNADSVVVYNGQSGYSTLAAEHRGDTLRLKLNKDPYTDLTYDAATKTLFFIDKNLNRIFRFVKADSSFLDTAYEKPITFPALVNHATFEGVWEFIENNKTKSAIEFTRKGDVKGWNDYQNYNVCVNGDCAINESGDVLVVTSPKQIHAYGFRSKGDTLTLYDLKPATTAGLFQHGQPVALLIRKK